MSVDLQRAVYRVPVKSFILHRGGTSPEGSSLSVACGEVSSLPRAVKKMESAGGAHAQLLEGLLWQASITVHCPTSPSGAAPSGLSGNDKAGPIAKPPCVAARPQRPSSLLSTEWSLCQPGSVDRSRAPKHPCPWEEPGKWRCLGSACIHTRALHTRLHIFTELAAGTRSPCGCIRGDGSF